MFAAMGYGVYIFFASLMILSIFYVYVRLYFSNPESYVSCSS